MEIVFTKYHASGNDFIIIDNRKDSKQEFKNKIVQLLCDRHYGVGADGLILIEHNERGGIHIDYRNADGSKSLCGNGSLCAVHYLSKILKENIMSFTAFDGLHYVLFLNNQISMNNVRTIKRINDDFELNTGSPHYVHFSQEIASFDIFQYGKQIRFSEKYQKKGINVNVVEELSKNKLFVRTYERGVENETLSCGTGATASAIAYAYKQQKIGLSRIEIRTIGHKTKQYSMEISFHYDGKEFSNIQFYNHVEYVFEGSINLSTGQ